MLPSVAFQGVFESETDDLVIAPIDATWNPSTLLRSRPLILDWNSNPAFQINSARQPLSESQAKAELERFLSLRGVDTITAGQILSRFDDPAVIQIVSAPSLRAALLMLSGLDPYEAVVSSFLEGVNESGLPFAAIEFADLGVENAVATVHPPSQENGWRFRLQISSQYIAEPPVQLIPALVHESLHGDGENSGPEEVIANILDTIAYGEMLLIDPDAAYAGTQLAAYNNLQLYSLLNSMGLRGGGHIGISTSVIGDVFVGPGLEDFDAGSIRDSILQDPFYGSLGAVDSTIPPTASALIQRFPGQTSLGAQPHFDESLLALIDRGVSHVITPAVALSLALTLGLSATIGSSEVITPLGQATVLDLDVRPFSPIKTSFFDLNSSRRPANVTDDRSVRLALVAALKATDGDAETRAAQLALFDDAELQERYPEAQLRAAIILLSAVDPWSDLANALLRSRPGDSQWSVAFAALPYPVNAQFTVGDNSGGPTVLVNEFLIGESLEITATALVEGILLEGDRQTPNGVMVSALLSTVAYAEFVENDPSIAEEATWGTISRNLDLLALLNSTRWSASSNVSDEGSLGFLAPASGVSDVLPGLLADAASFRDWVFDSARVAGVENVTASYPSELLLSVAEVSGLSLLDGPAGPIIDQTTLLQLDAFIGALIPPETLGTILLTLQLGVAG